MKDNEPDSCTDSAVPANGINSARKPGELVFTAFLCIASVYLLWEAYGIAGFEALSSPGAVPMATTAAMAISSVILLVRAIRLPRARAGVIAESVVPGVFVVFVLLLLAFSVLLKPLGFVPTAALFLVVAIKILGRRSWGFTIVVSLASLLVIWLVFRVGFTVLMPPGIVPEAEFIQFLRNVFGGGRS
ncbi:tripartite tricarboxylate transporter TctB family protein [Roseovarius aestuarii]|nr:tripartite tricarboxylate transporter TctB family protein [Roseovarius aestuarii]